MDFISQIIDTGFWGMGLIVSSLVLFVIGLPVQIYKNHQRKSVEGISIPLFVLYFAAYVIWLAYGLRIGEIAIIVPNAPAVIVAVLLILQFIIYRKKS